ncbi:hypothetical protein MIR68_003948 [Amoeboaphelidium protococcarum]|nr:hypothetical protein MIR68_003948 [Amoeboaphelidium protococcarum]
MVLQEDKEFGTALMLGHALTRKYGIGLIQYEAFDDAQFVNVTQANGAVIKDGFFTEDAQDSSLGKYYYRRLNLQISLVDDQLMSLCGKKSETIREELELSKQYCHVAVLVPFYTAVLEKNVFLQFAKQSLPSSSTSSTHRADQMVERIESSVSGDVPKDFRPTTVKNDHTALIVEQQQNLPTLLQQFDASMFKINGIMQGAESWLVRQIQERVDNTFQQKDLNPSLQSLLTQEYLRLILVDIERNFGDGNVNPDQYQKSRANQTSLRDHRVIIADMSVLPIHVHKYAQSMRFSNTRHIDTLETCQIENVNILRHYFRRSQPHHFAQFHLKLKSQKYERLTRSFQNTQ